LQLRQAPVHALSQQTPSTHWLEAHSLPPAQANPIGFGPQVLLTQAVPVSQSDWVWHELVQAPSTQRNG
jgi:predicted Abi (CAAX) family protease